MGGLSLWHWIVYLIIATIWIVPLSTIFGRVGFSKAWGLVGLFPPFAMIALWVIAFIRWPLRKANTDEFD